jgi:hypothetical protein
MTFRATKARVYNRGIAPDSFLMELTDWAKTAPDEIFAPNAIPVDIYTVIKSSLATEVGKDRFGNPVYAWDSLLHRKAALLETMRVHAGMESSWTWILGVDTTNAHSVSSKTGEETGAFQVSFDSVFLDHSAMWPFAVAHGIDTAAKFIPAMKSNHPLALEFYARLVRISIEWAGPLLRHGSNSVYPWLSRAAVAEFEGLLK